VPYLQCPHCRRTAWAAAGEPAAACARCDAELTTLPGVDGNLLVSAVRARFARDARSDAGRPRFLRASDGPHRLAE
jgi:hypothetical protein